MPKSPELDRLEKAMGISLKAGTALDVPDGAEAEGQFPFIVMSIEGEDGGGKSDFAMRAPKKPFNGRAGLVYFHTDYGYDRVRKEVRSNPLLKFVGVPYVSPHIDKKKQWKKYAEEGQVLHEKVWTPFADVWHTAMKHARTVVMDTGTEFWQFLRICHFGKLFQNPQIAYGPVKAEWMAMIREAKRNHVNLILLHQLKDEYKRGHDSEGKEVSSNTGRRIMDGMDKINYLVDSFLIARCVEPVRKKERNPKTKKLEMVEVSPRRFEIEIRKAKHDLSLNGMVMEDPEFGQVAGLLKPEVEEEAWE